MRRMDSYVVCASLVGIFNRTTVIIQRLLRGLERVRARARAKSCVRVRVSSRVKVCRFCMKKVDPWDSEMLGKWAR